MGLLLFVAFIAVPIAELYVILQIGSLIGALPTIALLIADSVLGAVLLRAQGLAAWRRFSRALAEARMPGREVMDGALVILGGALLLTPGFLTDALGLALLLPPTRAIVRAALLRRFAGRVVSAGAGPGAGRFSFWTTVGSRRQPVRDDDVIDAEARETQRRDELP